VRRNDNRDGATIAVGATTTAKTETSKASLSPTATPTAAVGRQQQICDRYGNDDSQSLSILKFAYMLQFIHRSTYYNYYYSDDDNGEKGKEEDMYQKQQQQEEEEEEWILRSTTHHARCENRRQG